MIRTRSFLFGVGAQKAGTSWLHKYLMSSPNVARTPLKEYHVWDSLYIPCCKRFAQYPDGLRTPADKLRYSLQRSPELYFTHFLELLDHTEKKIICDITPSYAGLDRTVFSHVKAQFAERQISTKAVFLMRDPVERCWSASRMNSRNSVGHTEVTSEAVLVDAKSVDFEMRTRYDLTIAELEAAFSPRELFIGFYEKLGQANQLRSLSSFCNVEPRPALVEYKVNVSRKTSPLDAAVAKQIAEHYRNVYSFVARRLPEAEMLWEGYRYL